jgi:hypothetical protein
MIIKLQSAFFLPEKKGFVSVSFILSNLEIFTKLGYRELET